MIIGFGVSIAFNADTFSIARKLGDDPEARMRLVEMAAGYTQSREDVSINVGDPGSDDADKIEAIRRQIDGLIDNEISGASDLLGRSCSPLGYGAFITFVAFGRAVAADIAINAVQVDDRLAG